MSKTTPKTPLPLIVVVSAFVLVCAIAALVSNVPVLACLTAVAVGAGVLCQYIFPANDDSAEKAANDMVAKSIVESRNEVINAMSILQQEIRLLQGTGNGATDKKALRDELARLSEEVAALKAQAARK